MSAPAPVDPATATGEPGALLAQVKKALGLTPNMTRVMANSAALLRGYLALSDGIASNHGKVGETELDAARQAGVSDAEIGEVVGHLALNVLTNYFNVLADVENDWPVIQLARAAA
jgi:alkylhydroperoxidase family enzyme